MPLRLLQLTDSHIFADAAARFDGVDTRGSFQAVATAASEALTPEATVLLTGDLSMDGSPASYAWLAAALPLLGEDIHLIAGNHDDPACTVGARRFLPDGTVLERGRWRLLVVDTQVPDAAHGAVTAAQCDRLRSLIVDQPDACWGLLMHHPPLPVDCAWMDRMGLNGADLLWEALGALNNVHFILCGHVHQNLDRWHRGVRVLASPSTCVQFAPKSARYAVDRRSPGFRVLDLMDDGAMETRIIRVA